MISNLRETIIEDRIPFNVIIPVVEKVNPDPDDPDGKIRIEGLARTTKMSLNHLVTTENFISSMKRQVEEADPKIPSFLDHDPNRIIGNIIGVKESKKTEFWPITELLDKSGNPVVDAPVEQVIHWINQNVRLGMSISGHATESKYVEDLDNDEWWIEANEGILFENSITPIPAQPETNGQIKVSDNCEYGFCNQLGEQIQNYLIENNTPIGEALKRRLEQRESKEIKFNQNKEVPNMAEKIEVDKTEWDEMKDSIKSISTYISEDIKAKKVKEKEEAERKAREELKAELKEEVAKEFTEEVIPSLAEVFNEAVENKFKALVGDRTHIQQSAVKEKTEESGEPQKIIIEQNIPDPTKSIAENHHSVVMGHSVKGYTPSEMFPEGNH